jgi:hypothetical protein
LGAHINTRWNSDPVENAMIWEATNRHVAEIEARIRAIQSQYDNAALQQQVATQSAQYNTELERQRQIIRNLGGIPAFATGGLHSGGMRLVGENGPELEVTGPARIFNARQTQDMFRASTAPVPMQTRGQQGDPALRQLVANLTAEVVNLRAEARAGALASQDQLSLTRRMTRNGQAMPVTGVQNDPLKVEVAA